MAFGSRNNQNNVVVLVFLVVKDLTMINTLNFYLQKYANCQLQEQYNIKGWFFNKCKRLVRSKKPTPVILKVCSAEHLWSVNLA